MQDPETTPVPYAALATTFVSAARDAIAHSLGSAQLTVESKVQENGSAGIHSGAPETISGWFLAEVGFRNAHVVGAFRFGERESALHLDIGIPGSDARYALSEWALALGRDELAVAPEQWVFQPERLLISIQQFGDALSQLYPLIANADVGIVSALEAARVDSAAERQEQLRALLQERDEVSAADAFRREAYDEAVRFLAAHESHLSPAQKRKLDVARRLASRNPHP